MANTTERTLFPLPQPSEPAAAPTGKPRLRLPERSQITMHSESLDQRLPEQHLARDVWSFVTNLDLTPLLTPIRAVEGQTGRDATDPRIFLSIWLLAFAESHSSAREVAELCQRDRAYEWLCGGVTINHHLLSDFRVAHRDYLNQLFTDTPASFLHEGLLDLHATAQDGMRVRASAGKASFRRQATLEVCLAEAQEHVARLDRALENGTTAEHAAQKRAARERVQRVRNALDQVQELARQREARTKGSGKQLRAQTAEWTNAQARNRNFYAVRVRGRAKVVVIALWFALIHNLLTAWRLRKEKAQSVASPPAGD